MPQVKLQYCFSYLNNKSRVQFNLNNLFDDKQVEYGKITSYILEVK
jgi:hypothetical protein